MSRLWCQGLWHRRDAPSLRTPLGMLEVDQPEGHGRRPHEHPCGPEQNSCAAAPCWGWPVGTGWMGVQRLRGPVNPHANSCEHCSVPRTGWTC